MNICMNNNLSIITSKELHVCTIPVNQRTLMKAKSKNTFDRILLIQNMRISKHNCDCLPESLYMYIVDTNVCT